MRVALLEDDKDQAALLKLWLEGVGHECKHFVSGSEFKKAVAYDSYDLMLIDWMLPDTNGVEILDWVRGQKGLQTPVLFVTQKDAEEDIVEALEHGADDYMSKPAKQGELLARVNALLRRASSFSDSESKMQFGDYEIDNVGRSISIRGEEIELTNKEFELAYFLFRNSGRILSRNHILESVWGRSPQVNTRTIDTHISRIRNKLKLNAENGWRLAAIYQHGYRLEAVESPSQLTESKI